VISRLLHAVSPKSYSHAADDDPLQKVDPIKLDQVALMRELL
jgi:hypothetical protein